MSSPYRVGAIIAPSGGEVTDHKDQGLNNIHQMHNYAVADIAAMLALVVTAADVGKIAKVASPAGFYALVDYTGPSWLRLSQNIDAPNITVSSIAPSNPDVNDIWIQVPA